MEKIRLIAIDIDGTLLDDQHQLSERNAAAIQAAIDAGIQVVLATGRMRHSCVGLIEQLDLQTAGIFVQGLHVASAEGQRIHGEFLDAAILDRFVRYANQQSLSFVAFGEHHIFALKRNELTDLIMNYDEPEPIEVTSFTDRAIHKIIILDDPLKVPRIRDGVETHMDTTADVMITQPEMVEIMPTGTSKGHSLAWLAAREGVPMRQVMAIGNAENDLAMVQMAGVGVAVGNAAQVVLDSDDYIVASNNADGVAEAIQRFALRRA